MCIHSLDLELSTLIHSSHSVHPMLAVAELDQYLVLWVVELVVAVAPENVIAAGREMSPIT